MKSYKNFIYIIVVVLAAVLCAAAFKRQQDSNTSYDISFFAMDTFFNIRVYGAYSDEVKKNCENRVEDLENLFSVTREDSDIAKINAGETIPVGEDTFLLIKTALELCDETEGALDITIYPVLKKWGFTTEGYHIPDVSELDPLLETVDYTSIELDDKENKIIVPEGAEVDLGAVAKGYTGDCLLALLREYGVESALLDLGGNVQTLGAKPDGSPWKIAVRDPFGETEGLGVLEVTDKAVITSGGYERYFIGEDGKRYWHILDPSNGYPADSGLVSVTIVGDSGVRCDGLSTALFVMGKDEAEEFWRRQGDFEMILVTEDRKIYLTEGLEDSFVCSEGWQTEIIKYQDGH